MKGASSAKAKLGYLENKAFDEMDEILYGYGFSYVHLRVMPLVNIAKAVAVTESRPSGPRASKKLCQPDNVRTTNFLRFISSTMRSTYLLYILNFDDDDL